MAKQYTPCAFRMCAAIVCAGALSAIAGIVDCAASDWTIRTAQPEIRVASCLARGGDYVLLVEAGEVQPTFRSARGIFIVHELWLVSVRDRAACINARSDVSGAESLCLGSWLVVVDGEIGVVTLCCRADLSNVTVLAQDLNGPDVKGGKIVISNELQVGIMRSLENAGAVREGAVGDYLAFNTCGDGITRLACGDWKILQGLMDVSEGVFSMTPVVHYRNDEGRIVATIKHSPMKRDRSVMAYSTDESEKPEVLFALHCSDPER